MKLAVKLIPQAERRVPGESVSNQSVNTRLDDPVGNSENRKNLRDTYAMGRFRIAPYHGSNLNTVHLPLGSIQGGE